MGRERNRIVLVSPWVGLLTCISLLFVAIGISIILQPNMDVGSLVIGWALTVGFSIVTVQIILSRIAVFSEAGFRTLARRKVTPWTEVLWVDIERETYSILPNWVVVVTCDKKDSEGRQLQVALDGFAGFSRNRRLMDLEELIDSWIEEANPGRVINPWIRTPRKRTPDHNS